MKFLIFLFFVGCATAQNSCITPEFTDGNCIFIKQCTPLVRRILKKPLPLQDRIYLARSQCGYRDGQPLVCCPPQSEWPTQPPATQPTSAPPPKPSGSLLPEPGSGKCGLGYEDRIFGGTETEVNEFPWLTLLQYRKGDRLFFGCGGVLLNENYVLTAAHCLDAALPPGITLVGVRLGEWDTTTEKDCDDSFANEVICSEPAVDIPVAEKIPHEGYDPANQHHYNDIAILRLASPVRFSDFIKPICLPSTQTLKSVNHVGEPMVVAGWGRTETKAKSERKLKVQVDGVDLNQCAYKYSSINVNLQQTQVCAGGLEGQDSCQGDSGGPLMTRYTTGKAFWYLVGVVSFGPRDCGSAGWPGVYTDVSKYIDWINSKVRP
jgi:hypothetical protein